MRLRRFGESACCIRIEQIRPETSPFFREHSVATQKHRRKSGRLGSRILGFVAVIFAGGLVSAALGGWLLYRHIAPQLPDIEVLRDVRYHVPMSVYSKDGLLIAQYGEQKSSPIAIADVPAEVRNAFLAAEDNRFFDHPGVDYQGLLRATFSFLRTGEKKQGGSTITMQVARNFFLSSEKTFLRKVREILLAIKIESKLSKEEILELYLNKIYFGHHAYGIVAAARVYYGKAVNELTLPETAMIAGLPKAPSAFNPLANPERAMIRRNYVLLRMRKLGHIDDRQYRQAIATPITTRLHTLPVELRAPDVAELVRNEMYQQYGDAAYTNGYKVYTTIDSRLQKAARKAIHLALHEYDERHGYRGTRQRLDISKVKNRKDWDERLAGYPSIGATVPGLVVGVKDHAAEVYLGGGLQTELDWNGLKWARKHLSQTSLGPFPRAARDILRVGDIVRLRKDGNGRWLLSQVPEAEGALVALDPKDGALQALVGGYDAGPNAFNRATQAQRQPGSGFKPMLYAAALADGYTPASVINDAPFVQSDPSQAGGLWRPQNYTGRFYGPTTLRVALAHSRNLVSVRLLRNIGIKKAVDMAVKFGFRPEELPNSLPLALGSGSATPLRMAQAYAVFANGGFRIEPYLIDRIETESGAVVYQATPQTVCADCLSGSADTRAQRVLSPQVHYMMNSMLQDVIRKGTATRALELKRSDIAGKTGTTNENRDAWFNGYAPALVTISWVGMDSSKSLGDGETGGHVALPMWIHFMREALKDVPEYVYPVPAGLTTARIDSATGQLAPTDSRNAVSEMLPGGPVPRYSDAPVDESSETVDDTELSTAARQPPPLPPPPKSAVEKPIESLF
jgi:penicillin-binding protein 1A